MELAEKQKQPFQWLTTTNYGASAVCEAALRCIGVGQAELDSGYLCDPTTKSDLRIVAKKGTYLAAPQP